MYDELGRVGLHFSGALLYFMYLPFFALLFFQPPYLSPFLLSHSLPCLISSVKVKIIGSCSCRHCSRYYLARARVRAGGVFFFFRNQNLAGHHNKGGALYIKSGRTRDPIQSSPFSRFNSFLFCLRLVFFLLLCRREGSVHTLWCILPFMTGRAPFYLFSVFSS